jgi:hypothetical protein
VAPAGRIAAAHEGGIAASGRSRGVDAGAWTRAPALVDFHTGLAQAAGMAREVIEQLVDDLDGSEAAETVSFGLDGVAFEIDLNAEHAADLRTRLYPYVQVARRVRGQLGGTVGSRRWGANRDRNAALRRWALAAGVELPGRGRIARGVQDAYDADDVPALYAATGLEMD